MHSGPKENTLQIHLNNRMDKVIVSCLCIRILYNNGNKLLLQSTTWMNLINKCEFKPSTKGDMKFQKDN